MTRLFTTMSPQDMTIDPDFDFNTGLGDVSNIHEATAECTSSNYGDPIRITLTDGRQLVESYSTGAPTGGPAAERIEQLSAHGKPVVLTDNFPTGAQRAGAKACGCGTGDVAPLGLAFAGLLTLRRRRAQAR
jgi:MYXO-CTERM domain-containing protein